MTTGEPAIDRYIAGFRPMWHPHEHRQTEGHAMTQLITADGIVTRWPKKTVDRQRVLAHLSQFFTADRIYREAEVNEVLRAHHTFEDWALLRREMYEAGIFDRDPKTQTYWRLDRAVTPV